jgi:hypothetical protein
VLFNISQAAIEARWEPSPHGDNTFGNLPSARGLAYQRGLRSLSSSLCLRKPPRQLIRVTLSLFRIPLFPMHTHERTQDLAITRAEIGVG